MQHVVKRAGHLEKFDERKVYASIFASCTALRTTDEEAELIADRVTDEIKQWAELQKEITAHQIGHQVVGILERYNEDAAYLYRHHKNIN